MRPGRAGAGAIKIGIAGNLVIGPAGSPGTYSVPLRITVTQDADHKQVYSKTYKIEATADAVSSGLFRIVADPIVVPMPTLQLAEHLFDHHRLRERAEAPRPRPRAHRRKARRLILAGAAFGPLTKARRSG